MDRKKFIKTALAPVALSFVVPNFSVLIPTKDSSNLTIKKQKKMKTIVHKASTRGHANHGWLNSYHSFSFANYYNPDRMGFGVLRVLNDDHVEAGQGFGAHPHDNMEIISIPLAGDLEHKDSMGNITVIKEGDIQVMSAGTGVTHSEYNKNKDKAVKFLQIWIFPKVRNVAPRYDQISIQDLKKENEFYQVLSPNQDDQGVWVNQDAWFSLGEFNKDTATHYKLNKEGNGVYLFILEGEVDVEGQKLAKRDGMGIWEADSFSLNAQSKARVLLMEIPMK